MQVLHCSDITQYWYTWLSFRLQAIELNRELSTAEGRNDVS